MNDTTKGPDAPAAGRTKTPRKASATEKAPRKRATRTKAASADDAATTTTTAPPVERDAREIPGYTWKEVRHPELNVVERVQVFDPQLAEEQGLTGQNREADLMNQQAQTTAESVAKAASPKE